MAVLAIGLVALAYGTVSLLHLLRIPCSQSAGHWPRALPRQPLVALGGLHKRRRGRIPHHHPGRRRLPASQAISCMRL